MTENLWTKIQKIQYKGTPVFGRDSNPQNTSEFVAIAGTVLFWLIVLLFFIFAKPFAKKPEFKTVQIVLSSTPVAKTEKKESAASSAAAKKAESTEKKIEKQDVKTVKEEAAASKPKTENKPKTETQKIAETPKKAPVEYAKSVEELMAEQMSTTKKSASDFNWDAFSDSDDGASSSVSQPQKVAAASTTGGSAAKVSQSTDTGVVSQTERDGSVSETASSNTTGKLSGVRNAKFIGNAGTSHSSELTAGVSNGSGKNQFAMTDGSSRGLLEPADPRIDLSEQAAGLIDSTINVTIFIEVQPSGNVTSVDFNPSSIVPPLVQSEIRAQLVGKWRFERAD
ncbi:MAG: hypothetical protein IJR80_03385 [Treponema sp.]|nr:hypothetical protein [Treponema sp.]